MKQFSPLEWIKISIANNYGLDKLIFEERIKWVNNNLEVLDEVSDEAEEPELYLKAVRAYRDALAGVDTGYMVGIDATTSGYSIMSMLSRCPQGLTLTNLIEDGKRYDLYSSVILEMNKMLDKENKIDLTSDKLGALTRKEAKAGIMTFGYFSQAKPKEIFNEFQLQAFYMTMHQSLPGAMDVMECIRYSMDGEALGYEWTLPDGHVAKTQVRIPVEDRIEIQECDGIRYTHRYSVNAADSHSVALGANIVQSIDAYIVRQVVLRCDFDVITVHDEFFTHPNNCNAMRAVYLEVCQEIVDANLLDDILSDILGYHAEYAPINEEPITLDGVHCLC